MSRLWLYKTRRLMRVPARTVPDPAPPAPETDAILTEAGDALITEGGDALITET